MPADPSFFGRGLCWFGVQRLPPLAEAFAKETDGVRAAEDIEYIHRMRVASRRLRAALPLFRSCFSPKRHSRWMKEITRITRALGDARDADVQIAYLKKYIKKKEKSAPTAGGEGPAGTTAVLAARYLLDTLTHQRRQLQEPVIAALDSLEKSGVIPEMQAEFARMDAGFHERRRLPPLHGIPLLATYRIEGRLNTLLSYEPWLCHPEAVAEHHATRIAAKKLRYTLEIYGPAYQNSLNKYLLRVKTVQEILGDLHDCDVWIAHVTAILLKERTLLRTRRRSERPSPPVLASMKVFLLEKERERRALYRKFLGYWARLGRAGTWEELRTALRERKKKRFCLPARPAATDVRPVVEHLAAADSKTLPHRRTVRDLALMLFDGLLPLHQLTPDDRFLLETACLLPGNGGHAGKKGPRRRAALAILGEESLAFPLDERAAIALAATFPAGNTDPEKDPLYTLLPPEYQRKALALAAIRQAAAGLDATRSGAVHEVHCVIAGNEVACDLVAEGDTAQEREEAQAAAGLFARVFRRSLVIR